MGTSLHELKPASGSVKNKRRLGRGEASGRGGTASRGHKGAKSRSGYAGKAGFEGGQMPLQRRVPKFGFTPIDRKVYRTVDLRVLQRLLTDGKIKAEVTPAHLIANGLARKRDWIKILGNAVLKEGVKVHAHRFSKSAEAAIKKAGGEPIIVDNKMVVCHS